MQHHQWIRLNSSEINHAQTMDIRGVEVSIMLAPADVPSGVRGYFDPKEDKFRIDFRYDTEKEPVGRPIKDSGTTMLVGRHTGRLYSILIDTKTNDTNAVTLAIETIDISEKGAERLNARKNREMIEGVLHKHAQEIARMQPA